jgi:putative ABC transport system permease protein
MLVVVLTVSVIFVLISRYTAVFERTHEIGILRAFGASSTYIFKYLIQETLLIAIPGTIIGIPMSYATKWVVTYAFSDFATQMATYTWWPIAGVIALTSSLLGPVFAAWRAIHGDVLGSISDEDVTEG